MKKIDEDAINDCFCLEKGILKNKFMSGKYSAKCSSCGYFIPDMENKKIAINVWDECVGIIFEKIDKSKIFKNCIFCGSKEICFGRKGIDYKYCAFCTACGAEGGAAETKKQAANNWNNRK